jgi:hypothetical protein
VEVAKPEAVEVVVDQQFQAHLIPLLRDMAVMAAVVTVPAA